MNDTKLPPVRHDSERSRFECAIGEEVAVCDYVEREGIWYFTHTYVPDSFRGKGIAAHLVRHAMEAARAAHKKVVPQCSYVAAWLSRTAEFQDLKA